MPFTRSKKHKHTAAHRGKRVIVMLQDGTIIVDRFVERAKNRRWIELQTYGRVQLADIKAFSTKKGELDMRRLGLEQRA